MEKLFKVILSNDHIHYFFYLLLLGTYRGRSVAVKIPLRKEDFAEALIEFKKLRNFRHRNVVEAIAYCKDPAMFSKLTVEWDDCLLFLF